MASDSPEHDEVAMGCGAEDAEEAPASLPEEPIAPVKVGAASAADAVAGQLFTWGRGTDGQLGQDRVTFPAGNCALPYPVRGFSSVVHVACGGGQQGSTAIVTASGALFTFGNNYKARLGHGEGPCVRSPQRVEALAGEFVLAAACGSDHSAALVRGGQVFSWGESRHGALGRAAATKEDSARPMPVELPGPAAQVDCEQHYSAAVLEDGRLFTWGENAVGKLGVGDERSRPLPTLVELAEPVASVSLGSLYAGAVTAAGGLLMWGYGGHGNLGLGNRRSVSSPMAVALGEPARSLACTRGQDGCKGGLYPKEGGAEGPHTIVVATSGALYCFGTCHKGLLGNLGSKDGAFGKPWDELRPYRLGGELRNGCDKPPMSPLALWPPPYDAIGPVRAAASGHIHAACACEDGRAWAWGCGSNDGRCGVERFLNMAGDGKPPAVDEMKCYLMGPHRIGVARPLYWKHQSLQGYRVLALATGRNHMAAIAVPDDVPAGAEPVAT